MKQIIYVDVLIVLNIFINCFLLLSTEIFTKEKAKAYRLLLGALLGGVYSLVVFLPEMGVFLNIITRLATGAVIVLASFGFKTRKRFFKLFSMFLVMTFLFAGLMIALWVIFKPNGMLLNNSTVYFSVSLPVLAVSTAVCYVVIRAMARLFLKNKPQSTVYDFTLEAFGKSLCGRAMLDTGNTLCESFSGYPAVVCTYDFLKEVLPEEGKAFFSGEVLSLEKIADENLRKKVRIISYRTVSNEGILPAFKPDKLKIKRHSECDKLYIAVVAGKRYINESFDMLLNPNLFN